jgi:hypothetical protein
MPGMRTATITITTTRTITRIDPLPHTHPGARLALRTGRAREPNTRGRPGRNRPLVRGAAGFGHNRPIRQQHRFPLIP